MNLPTKSLGLSLLASAFFFAGCNHTLNRPTADQTIPIIQGGGNGGRGSPGGNGGPGPTIIIPLTNTSLQTRPGDTGPEDRAALQAHTVYFAFDSSAIRTASEAPKLQAVQKYLAEHADVRLLLEGHCDWRGTAEYNLGLGDRRAASVKQYLVKLGIPAARLDVVSKGSIGAPEKANEEQMAKDRRVDFVLIRAGAATAPLSL